jgi:hypothetical protein
MAPKVGSAGFIVKNWHFSAPGITLKAKEDIMGVSSIGPSGLDPFSPTAAPPPEENREVAEEPREPAPLPEGSGSQVDTTA